ncbi:MAG: 50S ribosomal protein L25 [Planctomycetales bacterium]|nr:50S ribosomal protein L25 [Planctomycetales bacterium]
MSSETLQVKKRDQVGTAACNKLRQEGYVPANLYGHGEANVNLAVRADSLHTLIHQGTKLFSLTGDVADTALLREVQWDAFGSEVMHIDLTRVSRTESVEVTLPIELHGEAPGSNEGGQLSVVAHELTIRCPASDIPEHLQVNIGNLHLGETIHASDVALPAGAELITQASEVVVHVVKQAGGDTEGEEGATAEPELIRKDKEEEEA